jgi:hypothetical protein
MSTEATPGSGQKGVPAAKQEKPAAEPVPALTEAEALLLTEARTAKWKLEAYEFAYDAYIRTLHGRKTLLEFLAVLVAVVFLFLQYLVKEQQAAHTVLGYIGTGLSLAVILIVVWGYIARWPDQIEKKRELSAKIRGMLGEHKKLTEVRPLAEAKIRRWLAECLEFEGERKHELATVPRYYLKRAHQHIGNTYPGCGFKCTMCGREWVPEMNKRAFWTWLPFFGCNSCGV